jgi:hypothetical protein
MDQGEIVLRQLAAPRASRIARLAAVSTFILSVRGIRNQISQFPNSLSVLALVPTFCLPEKGNDIVGRAGPPLSRQGAHDIAMNKIHD